MVVESARLKYLKYSKYLSQPPSSKFGGRVNIMRFEEQSPQYYFQFFSYPVHIVETVNLKFRNTNEQHFLSKVTSNVQCVDTFYDDNDDTDDVARCRDNNDDNTDDDDDDDDDD